MTEARRERLVAAWGSEEVRPGMPHFVVYAIDKVGVLAQREALRPEHRKRLREHDHPVEVQIGGPLTDAEGAMVGSLFVIEAENREAVEAFLAGDPYVQADLYERCEVRPFVWGLGYQRSIGDG